MSAQTFPLSEDDHPLTLFSSLRFARHMRQPDRSILWLDEGPVLAQLLKSRDDLRGLSMFAAGDADGLAALAVEKGVSLTLTNRELTQLFNDLSAQISRHHGWEQELLRACLSPFPIQGMVNTVAELSGGCCFLTTIDHLVAYYSARTAFQHPVAQNMLDRKQLPLDQLPGLLSPNGDKFAHLQLSGHWLCCFRETGLTSNIGGIVLFLPDSFPLFEAQLLMELLRTNLGRYLQVHEQKSSTVTFQAILPDLIEGKLTSESDIDRLLSRLPTPPKQFYSFLLVSLSNPKIFPNARQALTTCLTQLFPESNTAFYGNTLVLLLSGCDRSFQPHPKFDKTRLHQLLYHYNAYAAFGNATSRRDMFRTQYTLAASTLEMGQALRRDSQERIFLFEDYAEYISIDLCVNTFSNILGHDDIIYLTHPAVTAVYRYDMAHQSDLLEILYYYCINNCNVSQAAKCSYMHRNTFSARLEELRRLVDLDFSDGEIRQRVIFSYKILRYYDRYAKINLMNRFSVSPPVQ